CALQDNEALARMAPDSLGRTYLEFMRGQNLSAEALVQASDAAESGVWPDGFSLYRERMRDMHDLTHVLTGYGRDPLGELCLLAFMFAHSHNPGVAMIVAMGLFRLPGRRAVFEAWRNGRKAEWLPGLDWESMLAQPLDVLRRKTKIAEPVRYLAPQP
ncbi:MAG TPA: Coq4 family protein, partial [Rhizomicrobium sp.]